jgi:toxin ParE1/3/4
MSYRVIFSPEAEEQLVALYLYVADAASPGIAAK